MSTFKDRVYAACNEVAAEFPGWGFVSGQFKNKSLKHTDLIIHPGFFFRGGSTPLQPSIAIDNKKALKLSKYILGIERSTSIVNFQVIAQTLANMPEPLRLGGTICQDKNFYMEVARVHGNYDEKALKMHNDRTIDVTEVRPVLVAMMQDGISFIENHYDLSSEEAFLRGLPAKYATRHVNSPYDEMDKHKGVMMCLVHVLLGDFEFVEYYYSDEFKTPFPKVIHDLEKIIVALPELKKSYIETATVNLSADAVARIAEKTKDIIPVWLRPPSSSP